MYAGLSLTYKPVAASLRLNVALRSMLQSSKTEQQNGAANGDPDEHDPLETMEEGL